MDGETVRSPIDGGPDRTPVRIGPTGDFAFAASVAAFGQVLRGDTLMQEFDFDDIGELAGRQRNFWRQEFLQLNAVAASMKGG